MPHPPDLIKDATVAFRSLVLLMLIFLPLELAFPQRSHRLFRPRLAEDFGYYFLNSLVSPFLVALAVAALVSIMRPIYLHGVYGWIGDLPLAVRFVLAIIVGDIGAYWGHRWSHEIPWLWHFHRIHHESEAIDWLVTSRAHPFDMVFTRFCGLALIYASGLAQGSLGKGTAVMSIYMIVGGFWAFLVHANLRWRFGFLEGWFASPAFHHWHHSNGCAESIDKNFSALFPWVDRLFGTLYLPRRHWPESYGLKESERASEALQPLADRASG